MPCNFRPAHLKQTAATALCCGLAFSAQAAERPETILQFFETSWTEITDRLPEIANSGYTALWLPPPTKGAEGTADVGFATFDRFDLGDKNQRGTIKTRYGSKAELLKMVDEAHRFGIKVYFDTVMNHNSNPSRIENSGVTLQAVGLDQFPGTRPLDFHVLPARDAGNGTWEVKNPSILGGGSYILHPATADGENQVATVPMPTSVSVPGYTHLARAPRIDFSQAGEFEEQYLSLLGLVDFAIEQLIENNGPAANDGTNLVAELPLPRFVRHPNEPSTYLDGQPVEEDIREMMMRWIQWFGNETNCDGLRLDAIKHVPTTFFASDFTGDPIDFNGVFQRNLNQRRGFTDADDDDGSQDALLFGESFTGDLGSLQSYRNTGMYLLDFPLLFKMAHDGGVFARWGEGDIGQLSYPQGGMGGAFNEFGGLGRMAGVSFVQSHDTYPPGAQANAAYAYILTRVGHSVVFYDGNNYDPNSFVTPGRADALGELNSETITTLVDIRNRFARGGMFNRFVDGDTYVYERVVATSSGMGGASLLVALTDNTNSEARFGEFDARPLLVTEFPPGTHLVELTGNGSTPQVQVLDPSTVPESVRARALAEYDRSSDFPLPAQYGLLYLQIPAGPDRGYVAYAPVSSPISLQLTHDGVTPGRKPIQTAGVRRSPSGAVINASQIEAFVIPSGENFSVELNTSALADRVFIQIDDGQFALGHATESNTSEGLYDGFIEASRTSSSSHVFVLAAIETAALSPGVHLLTIRAANAGTPSFYSEVKSYVWIENETMGLDAGVSHDQGLGDFDASAAPEDAGFIIDRDMDRDGVDDEQDNCPKISNPSQSDFDQDGRGDACDACPESRAGEDVDADGCRMISSDLVKNLDAIIDAILQNKHPEQLDWDKNGIVDVRDFALKARSPGSEERK